jgi:hypothetical protein
MAPYRTAPCGFGLVRFGGDTVSLSRLSSVGDGVLWSGSDISLGLPECPLAWLAQGLRQGDPRAFGATNRGPSTRNDATRSPQEGNEAA